MCYKELELERETKITDLGEGGCILECRIMKDVIREEIVKHGVHDKLLAYPLAAMAMLQVFQAINPEFGSRDELEVV